MKHFIACCALILMVPPALANDSSAAIGIGGLKLTQNDAVSMDSEELFLSMDRVTVKYRFTNTSMKDVETLISFPLPMLPPTDAYMGDQAFPDWMTDLDFKTLVDGKPVILTYREEISARGRPDLKNIDIRLKERLWPVHYWEDYDFAEKYIAPLAQAEQDKLVASGLLRREEYVDQPLPNWQVQAHVTRMQKFPAGKTITVQHSYKPVTGGSVGGILERNFRKDVGYKEYAAQYCIDRAFLKGFDKQRYSQKRDAEGNEVGQFYVENWLSYVLKSGANWKGPIKEFRLVIDKGKASNLVSFCMSGVKKISPTQFEVRRKNFEPATDLDILIVQFAPFE